MATTAKTTSRTTTSQGLWLVRVKGYPIMGLVDDSGHALHSRPVERHYRQKRADEDGRLVDGWHTVDVLRRIYGVESTPADLWQVRLRPRGDLAPALFAGAVVEADSEYEARAVFRATYGLRDTAEKNWHVEQASSTTAIGPHGQIKRRASA